MTPESQNGKTDSKREIRIGFDRPLRIGTRQSPLAMAQAELAAHAIRSAQGWRNNQVELVSMIASGDKIQDRALADSGGKALWTKELDRALLAGEIDCAVHSMKDVETIRADNIGVAAMLERADTHDRIVGAESIESLSQGAVVGTASPRRKAQLLNLRDDLEVRLIRGNVQTRLKKVEDGEFDATLLAAAGLLRLEMDEVGSDVPDDVLLPAASQGAIGLETRDDAHDVRRMLLGISSDDTHTAVSAERSFLRELAADCHSPVAALAIVEGPKVYLRAQILLPDGSESVSDDTEFDAGDVAAPGRLAKHMLGIASDELKAIFKQ